MLLICYRTGESNNGTNIVNRSSDNVSELLINEQNVKLSFKKLLYACLCIIIDDDTIKQNLLRILNPLTK